MTNKQQIKFYQNRISKVVSFKFKKEMWSFLFEVQDHSLLISVWNIIYLCYLPSLLPLVIHFPKLKLSHAQYAFSSSTSPPPIFLSFCIFLYYYDYYSLSLYFDLIYEWHKNKIQTHISSHLHFASASPTSPDYYGHTHVMMMMIMYACILFLLECGNVCGSFQVAEMMSMMAYLCIAWELLLAKSKRESDIMRAFYVDDMPTVAIKTATIFLRENNNCKCSSSRNTLEI